MYKNKYYTNISERGVTEWNISIPGRDENWGTAGWSRLFVCVFVCVFVPGWVASHPPWATRPGRPTLGAPPWATHPGDPPGRSAPSDPPGLTHPARLTPLVLIALWRVLGMI